MATLYGIKNCDSVRKARQWLNQADVEYKFHDFRADGLDAPLLKKWFKQIGWETLLNKRGTTFRQLADSDKQNLNESRAYKLMLAEPTLIKRPVLERGKKMLVGFSEANYKELF